MGAIRFNAYRDAIEPRLKEIEAWRRDGLSTKDISHNLGIADSTLRRWAEKEEALSAVLARGKEYVDDVIVANAYLRRVTGYDAVEYKREFKISKDDNGNEVRELVKLTEQTRHIPADPRAAEFWLTNRQPDKWKYPQKMQTVADEENDGQGVIVLPAVEVT
jgi:hypothetical protein